LAPPFSDEIVQIALVHADHRPVALPRDVVMRQVTASDQAPRIVRGAVEDGCNVFNRQEHGDTLIVFQTRKNSQR
jgi:superfamily II helicase